VSGPVSRHAFRIVADRRPTAASTTSTGATAVQAAPVCRLFAAGFNEKKLITLSESALRWPCSDSDTDSGESPLHYSDCYWCQRLSHMFAVCDVALTELSCSALQRDLSPDKIICNNLAYRPVRASAAAKHQHLLALTHYQWHCCC
jgi:hypothetical protein